MQFYMTALLESYLLHLLYKLQMRWTMFHTPFQSIWLPIAAFNGCTSTVQIQQSSLHSIKPFDAYSYPVKDEHANFQDCSIRELWCNMAARTYIDCTIFNWGQQCFTHHFNPFGWRLHLAMALCACTLTVQIRIDFSNVPCIIWCIFPSCAVDVRT